MARYCKEAPLAFPTDSAASLTNRLFLAFAHGRDEAVLVNLGDVLKRIEIAFHVVDDSAVPLALEKQVVLGGSRIELDELGQHKDALVALTLDDGSSIFKRVVRCFQENSLTCDSSKASAALVPHKFFRSASRIRGSGVRRTRAIIGVLYHS
jgi:hypothetical protein